MKLLIAYDGSRCAESAIDDLRRAGLPAEGEATVISVAEVWLPPANSTEAIHMTDDPYIEKMIERHREKGERALAETRTFSCHGEIRLKGIFPD